MGRKFDPGDCALLEEPERLGWQDPQRYLNLLGTAPGHVVLDVGAGTGFLALPAGYRVAPTGRVFAVDVQEAMLRRLRERARAERLRTVFPVLSDEEHIPLSDGIADLGFMINVLHEITGSRTLEEVFRILRPGGRLLVVDWAPGATDKGPPPEERIPMVDAVRRVERVGFDHIQSPTVGPFHYGLVAVKPGAPPRPVG